MSTAHRAVLLLCPLLVLATLLVPLLVLGSAAMALHEDLVHDGYAWHCLGKTCLFIGSGDAELWWSP